MNNDPKVLLQHILESIGYLQQHLAGVPQEEFMDNVLVQDGVEKRLENIGEAVANLPDEVTKLYPQTPWQKISGLRNVLIHEYFGVDLALIWNIANQDIPELKKQVKIILKNLE